MTMTCSELQNDHQDRALLRTNEHLAEHKLQIYKRCDRMFACLIGIEWIAGVVAALLITPKTWSGSESTIHPHVWTALILGGIIAFFPIVLALIRPGATATRHTIAVAQVLF